MTTVLVDGAASIVIDDAHWPIIIVTWFGQATVNLLEQYFAQQALIADRARRQNGKFIMVSDATDVERPSAVVRQRLSELTQKLAKVAGHLTLKSYCVLTYPIVRGVATAMGWVIPEMREVEFVATLPEALERALNKAAVAG